MNKNKILAVIFFMLTVPAGIFSQFTPEEIAARPEVEQLLRTADIVKSKPLKEGITKPYRLYLAPELDEISGCWKNVTGKPKGYLDEWRFEIAAYVMDKLLGVNMVPPTVEKIFDRKKGSIQLWVTTKYNLQEITDQRIPFPNDKLDHLTKMRHLSRAFDCVIANEDRTAQNLRFTDDWRVILIDHSRSFRASKRNRERLMFGKNGIQARLPILMLPRTFVDNLRSLTFEKIKAAMGDYLTKKEIEAIIERKAILLAEIQETIDQIGESKFFY